MACQVRPALLKGLVALLTPPGEKAFTSCDETAKEPATLCPREPMLVYIQQAAAAKAIGVLAKESAEVAEELIQLKVVHGLMVAVGNLDHAASQRHASISLEVSRNDCPPEEKKRTTSIQNQIWESVKTHSVPECL